MKFKIDNLQYCNWSRKIFEINREAGLDAVHATIVYHEDFDEHLNERGFTVDDDNRCQYLMSDDGIVEQALWAQSQAFIRNETKHLLMVEYDDIVNTPQETMDRIYNFLEVDGYKHGFNNVKNNHRESEKQWNLKDMHHVRNKVQKISKKPEDVLSSFILNKYSKLEYWKYPDSPYLEQYGKQ